MQVWYVEFFRNIPLLLQIFFWYFAALRALPIAREMLMQFLDISFLTIKVFMFQNLFGQNFNIFFYSILAAIIAIFFFNIHAKKLQETQGKQIPTLLISIGIYFSFTSFNIFNWWCKFII